MIRVPWRTSKVLLRVQEQSLIERRSADFVVLDQGQGLHRLRSPSMRRGAGLLAEERLRRATHIALRQRPRRGGRRQSEGGGIPALQEP